MTSRRNFIAGGAAATVAASFPIAVLRANAQPDKVIEAAWARRAEAFRVYNSLPFGEDVDGAYTQEEAAQWAIIDEAEEVIRSTVATTTNGAAIQLWVAFSHCLTCREDEAATLARNLEYFDTRDKDLDWDHRLILAALRSLEPLT